MKRVLCAILTLVMVFAITACGEDYSPAYGGATNSASLATSDSFSSTKSFSPEAPMAYEEAGYYDYDEPTLTEADIVKDSAMIVRTANLSVDVANLIEFADNLTERVDTYGGYFENRNIDNYSSEYSTRRYGYFTVRVPQEHLDEFLNDIDGASSVTSKNESLEDVSLEYVDVEARIDALRTQQETLMRLLEESDNITDTLEINARLTDVNYELDSYVRQQRTLAGRVAYSTVYINACEERNVDHPIRLALEVNFKERMIDGIEEAADIFVGIVTAIPVIVIIVAFGILFLWILRKIWQKVFRRKGTRQKVRYMLVPMMQSIEPTENAPATGPNAQAEQESANEKESTANDSNTETTNKD